MTANCRIALDSPVVGDIVQCTGCGVELMVTGLNPTVLELAPQPQSWGD